MSFADSVQDILMLRLPVFWTKALDFVGAANFSCQGLGTLRALHRSYGQAWASKLHGAGPALLAKLRCRLTGLGSLGWGILDDASAGLLLAHESRRCRRGGRQSRWSPLDLWCEGFMKDPCVARRLLQFSIPTIRLGLFWTFVEK